MITKQDQKKIESYTHQWKNFLSARSKRAFDYDTSSPLWLSCLEREEILTDLLGILERSKDIRLEVDLELE